MGRKASEGLVGIAKRDGDWCAEIVNRHTRDQDIGQHSSATVILDKLASILKARKSHPVDVRGSAF